MAGRRRAQQQDRVSRGMPIAAKVLGAVSAGLVALLVVGVFGALGLRSVNARTSSLYTGEVQPLERLADLRAMEGKTRLLARDYLLSAGVNDRSAQRRQITDTDARLDADI